MGFLREIEAVAAGFLKNDSAIAAGFLKNDSAISAGFLKNDSAISAGFLKNDSAISAGFIKQNQVYTGSSSSQSVTSYPIGTNLLINGGGALKRNQSASVCNHTGVYNEYGWIFGTSNALSGVWRKRGQNTIQSNTAPGETLMQRTV